MLRYLISICLVTMASAAFSQKEKVQLDTTSRRFIPTGIRVGADLIGFGKSFSKVDYKQYEFQADIDFYRYFLNVEYGQMERTLENSNSLYTVEGSYFKVGPDINFLHRDPDQSALFFGLRYATTTFSDELNFSYTNDVFGDGTSQISNTDLKADWFEMVTGMKVKMWKFIWLGYTARFKFGIDTFERNELIPHEIPGYGRADKNVSWGFNYYLIFRIPLRKGPQTIELPSTDDLNK
ncbi:hypothetical protein JMN32_01460 [Fulvivirga sp. 29W222]|uniref:Outer membrane protein beta-barrel domain-containing protein n=1 Tax=Fulvivirga marina TaxID=2494733 RepID=A0A937FUW9_9BACT|nr:DUF6048 family protein [Fulvivirga marina]MBL6444957.1 hypothetical protein [Fulvivirga marina]